MSNSGKLRLWGFFEVKVFALLGSIILLSLNITELITTCELSVHAGLLTTFSKRFCFSESKSVCKKKKNCGVYHLSGFVISL